MAEDRFRSYQYGLVRFFRSRGYEVNSIKKTIKIDAYSLNKKESERLKQLQNWGFAVIDPKPKYSAYNPAVEYESEESFIDFADEIIWMYENNIESY